MDVKDAVWKAATYVADMESFAIADDGDFDRQAFLGRIDFAVEGVRYDEAADKWHIDVGFVRSWDRSRPNALAGLSGQPASNSDLRTFKEVVVSDDDGRVTWYGASDRY